MATSLLQHAERTGAERALSDEVGSTTWAELNERTNRLIDVLRNAGLEHGDRVAVLSGNRREAFEAYLACLHAGLAAVPMNWNFTVAEAAFVLSDSDARVLIADDAYEATAVAAAAEVTSVVLRLLLGDGPTPEGFERYEDVLAAADPAEPAGQITGSAMFYTSGTTGRPKGVLSATFRPGQPVDGLQEQSKAVATGLGIPIGGHSLLVGPSYHSGQWAMTVFPLLAGSPMAMLRFPETERVLDIIDAEQITNVLLLPTDFVRLLKLSPERRATFDGSSLVQVLHGGAPCSPEVKQQMLGWWGDRITEYYGASEGGVFCLVSADEWRRKPGSVGRVLPFLESRVVNDDNVEVGPGEEGLIYFRHLSGADFEYHKQPEKTAEAHLEPGMFTLGDVGFLDADGYLYISDRRSEVINTGGTKIYPAEIEGVLAAHPAVQDVAVLGVPNSELGEEIKAAVQLVAGEEPTPLLAEAILAYAAERLAANKVPHSVDFHAELPRSDAGKLAKHRLRERYWANTGRRI